MQEIEKKLEELLVKKAPVQIPENARKWIATYAWIFALVGVIFSVLAFLPLLAAVGFVSVVGTAVGAGGSVVMVWLSLIVLVGMGAVLAIAVPKLKAMNRSGWQLLYYAALFSVAYGLVTSLRSPLVFMFTIVWTVLWAVLELSLIHI